MPVIFTQQVDQERLDRLKTLYYKASASSESIW